MARPKRFRCTRAPLLAFGVLVLGCAGAAPKEPESAPAAEELAEPVGAPAPSAPTESETSSESASSAEPSAAEPTTASEIDAPRDIRYVQTPEGLRIEILGVKFVPKAETTKTPGGIGVKLTLEVTASEPRSLLAPERGPLAFAGAIQRKGKGDPETFGDDRKGDGELVLDPEKPTTLVREWPGKGKPGGLGNGDVLELDVGLWGLGATAAERRPVKQFLRVKVNVERWKGRARVEPPPSAKGQG